MNAKQYRVIKLVASSQIPPCRREDWVLRQRIIAEREEDPERVSAPLPEIGRVVAQPPLGKHMECTPDKLRATPVRVAYHSRKAALAFRAE